MNKCILLPLRVSSSHMGACSCYPGRGAGTPGHARGLRAWYAGPPWETGPGFQQLVSNSSPMAPGKGLKTDKQQNAVRGFLPGWFVQARWPQQRALA